MTNIVNAKMPYKQIPTTLFVHNTKLYEENTSTLPLTGWLSFILKNSVLARKDMKN